MEPDHHGTAREAVLREPFWGAFRRRRPDVDVVLLPPADGADPAGAAPDGPYDEPAVVVAAAERAEAVADALWHACLAPEGHDADAGPDDAGPDTGPAPRWTHGPRKGVVRREVSRVLAQADPVTAALAVDRGAATLQRDGWRVTQPSGGTPHAVATRGEGARQEEVLVLAAVDTGRVVVRYRSPGLVLPRAVARRLVTGGAA